MKRLLSLILLTAAYPLLVRSQSPGILPIEEVRAHKRALDSLRAVTAQKHRETEAYNDAYIRQHPNYLRQHPEIVKGHPEYRKRYAKYLSPVKR